MQGGLTRRKRLRRTSGRLLDREGESFPCIIIPLRPNQLVKYPASRKKRPGRSV